MAKSCCQTPEPDTAAHNDPRWRRVLWIALIANAAMFVVEMVAGVAADSRSLQPMRSISSAMPRTTRSVLALPGWRSHGGPELPWLRQRPCSPSASG